MEKLHNAFSSVVLFSQCKAIARVRTAKTVHSPHSSKFVCCSKYFLCCSMYCLFCVVLCIVCVYMCTVRLPPGGYPIAVKYIISYHNEELRDCYCLPGIIREINIRKMKLVRNVARVGGMRNESTYFQAGNLGHLETPRVHGNIILKWIFKRERVELCELKSAAQDKDQCPYAPYDDSSGSLIGATFLKYFIYNQVFAFSFLINP